jgi:hypothetical protein
MLTAACSTVAGLRWALLTLGIVYCIAHCYWLSGCLAPEPTASCKLTAPVSRLSQDEKLLPSPATETGPRQLTRTYRPKVQHEGLHKGVVLHSSPPEVSKVCSGNRQLLLGICIKIRTYTIP